MEHKDFEILVKLTCQQENLPQALKLLQACEEDEVAQAALALAGQFSLAEVAGERRIYHVSELTNDDGELEEFVEFIMNEGEPLIQFVAWFFETWFEIKPKDTYQIAGKTYRQPKRV